MNRDSRRAIERRLAGRIGQPEVWGHAPIDVGHVRERAQKALTMIEGADDVLGAIDLTDPNVREAVDGTRADLAGLIGRMRARLHRLEHPRPDGAP